MRLVFVDKPALLVLLFLLKSLSKAFRDALHTITPGEWCNIKWVRGLAGAAAATRKLAALCKISTRSYNLVEQFSGKQENVSVCVAKRCLNIS